MKATTNGTFTMNQVSTIIKGIFALGVSDTLASVVKTPFEFGSSHEADFWLCRAELYNVRRDIVMLMPAADTPLQDRAREGSLNDDENKRLMAESEMEIERRDLLTQAMWAHSILERRCESLMKGAREEREEAGKKTTDGGRFRLNRHDAQGFKGSVEPFNEWLVKQRASVEAGTPWHIRLERASELIGSFKHVDAQTAKDEAAEYFQPETLVRSSERSWDFLLSKFEAFGMAEAEYNKAQQVYNALGEQPTEAQRQAFIKAGGLYRAAQRSCHWWYETLTKRWDTLCITGTPMWLTNHPEWRAQSALVRAQQANIKAMEAKAAAAEADALATETEANMVLFQARMNLKRSLERQAQLEAELEAMMHPPKKASNAKAPTVPEQTKEVIKPAAKSLMPRTINSRRAAS